MDFIVGEIYSIAVIIEEGIRIPYNIGERPKELPAVLRPGKYLAKVIANPLPDSELLYFILDSGHQCSCNFFLDKARDGLVRIEKASKKGAYTKTIIQILPNAQSLILPSAKARYRDKEKIPIGEYGIEVEPCPYAMDMADPPDYWRLVDINHILGDEYLVDVPARRTIFSASSAWWQDKEHSGYLRIKSK